LSRVRTAFVPGAGLGKRLRPLTAERPKPLVPVRNRPLITHVFDALIEVGIERFVVNTHHRAEAYGALVGNEYRGREIAYIHEPVLLETGGQVDISRVPGAVVKVMDVKCPGSGEADKNEWANIDRLGSRDQVKFVIKDRADYEYARDTLSRHALDRRCAAVLFSPVHGVMHPRELSEWILEDKLPVRLGQGLDCVGDVGAGVQVPGFRVG